MKKIIIFCGISNSGKSTQAANIVQHNPEKYVRINRDDIKSLIWGLDDQSHFSYYDRNDLNRLEKEVTKYEEALIRKALLDGKTVISDNTNLKLEYIRKFEQFNVPIELEFFDITLKEAQIRNAARSRKGSNAILERQYQQYLNIRKVADSYSFTPIDKTIKQDVSLPKAVIFDIDGCLAKMSNRSAYDWKKVKEDTPIEHVKNLINIFYNQGHVVFVFTGRDGSCRELTREWLIENNINHSFLFSRKEGDGRKDSIIKEELFNENVKDKFYVDLVVDDRMDVKRMWLSLGLPLLSNNPLAIEF